MFEKSKLFLEIYGESHGEKIGMRLKGIEKGINIDLLALQAFVDRRKSRSAAFSTKRFEPDSLVVESGIRDGLTTGDDIVIEILNTNVRFSDYDKLKHVPRPSHADYPAFVKFDGKLNMSGGGKFSGRLTAPMVVAGGIAAQILGQKSIRTHAYISELGGIYAGSYKNEKVDENRLFCIKKEVFPLLDDTKKPLIEDKILTAAKNLDSLGGIIEAITFNLPAGVGDSMFDSLESKLSSILFAIPAVKGVEFGLGFDIASLAGSAANDQYFYENGVIKTFSNNNGGILGGISNGMPLTLRVAIKPTPSIGKVQKSVNLETGENVEIAIEGRHDACIVPRAVVVVEAAINIALLDSILEN